MSGDEEEEEESDGLPNECPICNNKFKNPISTKCHYFCEKCAFDHYKKSKKCPVCQKPLSGIFNVATDIIQKMNGKKSENLVKAYIPNRNKKTMIQEIQDMPNGGVDEDSDDNIENKLEGVQFSQNDEERNSDEKADLEKLSEEFKREMRKKKVNFISESDWML